MSVMNEENFQVKYLPLKNCFLQFSSKWFSKINNPKFSCLRLTHPSSKQKLFFSWAPQPAYAALNDCSVGINATFAQALNLYEGELVVISTEENVVSLQQIYLTPVTADDYEILELSRENVEDSLLNQIRIVFIGQVIVVWVSKTMNLKLTIDRLEPDLTYGQLEDLSELVILNISKTASGRTLSKKSTVVTDNHVPTSNTPEDKTSYWDLFANYLPKSVFNKLAGKESIQQETGSSKPDKAVIVCRVHPIASSDSTANCCQSVHSENVHPFNVFVSKSTLKKQTELLKNSFVSTLLSEQHAVVLCRLDVVLKKKSKTKKSIEKTKEDSNDSKQSISVCVRLCRIEGSCCELNKEVNFPCVFVSKFLRKVLKLNVGGRVRIQAYKPPMNKTLAGITLIPSTKLNTEERQMLIHQFKQRISWRDGVLVNDCCPFPISQPDNPDLTVLVVLLPEELDCWPLTSTELEVTGVTVSEEAEKNLESLRGYYKEEERHSRITSVFEDLQNQGVATLQYGLELISRENQTVPSNILITGKKGSGKSRLAESIYSALSGDPYYIFVSVLDCKPLRGKKPESVAKIVTEHLEECLQYQPSVLVLEDLQCVASAAKNNAEPSQENLYYLRMATVLKELLWQMSSAQMLVIATAESHSQVHPQLLAARGRHSFTTFLHIPPLSKADRLKIITELVNSRLPRSTLPDLDIAAVRTEGGVARDLCRLVEKLLFRACQRRAQAVELTAEDVSVTLEDFVPSELVNVSVSRRSTFTFSSVGGLRDAKRQLTEVLIWPNKYPEVFSQCPLRLERGVLLYGAPGTGKTLLATAIVGESGLNSITVKGPELLSKYIGASEEAVRNVFEKAQSARPCILFFDEFDSLAPRRGHDSTGVTDRVVNQLLTQMDGVETLEGVWVVAAASRPDLLDPALLRPGRIGNLIHCPTPDQGEREEILASLSTKLQLSDDVDLCYIASQTDGYTGADLQAVLFTAQMIAYDALNQDSDDEFQTSFTSPDDVVVCQSNLLAALKDTCPSLKPQDRIRFQQIYEQFQKSSRDASRVSSVEPSLRVTLA